jgi:histidyl-tRNA synthetase
MKIPPVKGTRDFYPPDMARRNWIIDGWKKVSVRNGFEEYDGPIFEYLKMFQIKSGDEIVEQLFSFQDRGGRELALRPEITPTLARMVNQQINSLPKPIKWFSVPRLFRAERPQKGRLREFFQWNIDIIGVDDVLADAEVIFTTVDYLREVGLTPDDIVVKISSRELLASVLKKIGISEDHLDSLYSILDKKSKLPPKTFTQMLREQVSDRVMADKIQLFMDIKNVSEIRKVVEYKPSDEIDEAANEQAMLIYNLDQMGIADYCVFDPGIVRGLAYYTGIVFEVHDLVGDLRAICGGGRFDNLLHDFGGPPVPATGMGMGDCVLQILLERKGLIDKNLPEKRLDYFVAAVDEPLNITTVNEAGERTERDIVIQLTAYLRRAGCSAVFSYKSGGLSKQLREASDQNAKKCIIIGEEFKENKLTVKDMATGEQELVDVDKFLSGLKS